MGREPSIDTQIAEATFEAASLRPRNNITLKGNLHTEGGEIFKLWILHGTELAFSHFKDSNFICRTCSVMKSCFGDEKVKKCTVSVFDASQETVGLISFAFEVQDNVHNVFQHLWTGKVT